MSQPSVTVVGNGNIAGNILNNDNRTQNFFTGPQRDNAIAMLELKVAFDALLNAGARYPAPKCHVDTRKAAQAVVTDWICGRGDWAEKGIMWISGAPGVGKSAIVQTVCETLDADDGSKTWLTKFASRSKRKVDGCHFFGKGLGDREKASFLPATIAFQLCRSSSTCRDLIKKAIKAQPDILTATFPSQFRQLLTATAKKRWPFQRPITIVIDALDECGDLDDQVELLKLILEAVTTTKMRFLIASRPEHQIHTFFQRDDVSQHTYHVRLDEETFNTSRDIEVFLRAEFARIRREKPHLCFPLPNGEDWPGNVVVIWIRDDSDSQFIFPTLAIGFIDTPFYTPDQQLQILLAAPPPRAFSKLDALYERILSRCPPDLQEESDELFAYQKLVIDILAVVVAFSEPIYTTTIAGVVDVVQNIVLGLMRSLFKVDTTKPNPLITLCHKSLRDYLLDIERSHKFFIPSSYADALFIGILSRCPPSDRWYSRDELMGVLSVAVVLGNRVSVPQIATFLDVAPSLVEGVVFGPAKALFKLDRYKVVDFAIPSFKGFLLDANRAGDYFIPSGEPDTLFTQILSRQPPSDPSHSYYSREALMGVLSVVVEWRTWNWVGVSVPRIASFLDVAPSLVEGVVFGPAKALFELDSHHNVSFSTPPFKDFLLDASRAGEFFISRDKMDTRFTRILSCQPSSDPSRFYSREVLMGVLNMVVERGNYVKVPQIASFLDVAPVLVECVVFGPAKALFKLDRFSNVDFSILSFKDFLLDANRAGEFFISRDEMDSHFTQILSRQPSGPSRMYSQEVLMGILRVLVVWSMWLSIAQIASSLGIDPGAVEGIIFGMQLFYICEDGDLKLIPEVAKFLQDIKRAGEFYIPPKHLNPHYDSLYAKIEKIRRHH